MPKSKNHPPAARPDKPPQTIRGGFIVVRRQERTGRLLTRHGTAYEHGSAAEAQAQAGILAEKFGCEFAVFHEVAAVLAPAQPQAVAETVAPASSRDPDQAPTPGRRRGTLTLRKAAAPA